MDYSNSYFITSYVEYVRRQLGLTDYPLPTAPRLGVISRKNRRRIVNEQQLVNVAGNAIQSELIEYSGLSFKEQVSEIHNQDPLIYSHCLYYVCITRETGE